jgi:hypothetical protein
MQLKQQAFLEAQEQLDKAGNQKKVANLRLNEYRHQLVN